MSEKELCISLLELVPLQKMACVPACLQGLTAGELLPVAVPPVLSAPAFISGQ